MRVRAINAGGDWTFGKGSNDYKRGNFAIAQNIQTRLNSFLGDCFFDLGAGIDWFNLLGSKDLTALSLSISAVIANTDNVIAIKQLSINVDSARRLRVVYAVDTSIGLTPVRAALTFKAGNLTTQDGGLLTTEDGNHIVL